MSTESPIPDAEGLPPHILRLAHTLHRHGLGEQDAIAAFIDKGRDEDGHVVEVRRIGPLSGDLTGKVRAGDCSPAVLAAHLVHANGEQLCGMAVSRYYEIQDGAADANEQLGE